MHLLMMTKLGFSNLAGGGVKLQFYKLAREIAERFSPACLKKENKMLKEKIYKIIEKESDNRPQHSNRMSSIGFPCMRNLVYQRTHWSECLKHDTNKALVFHEGRIQEKDILSILNDSNLKIISVGEPVILHRYELTGHIDACFQYKRNNYILEIKTISPNLFDKINSMNDFEESKYPHHNCYYPQIQLYMKSKNFKHGILLLKNKNTGELKEFETEENKPYIIDLLDICDDINIIVKKINDKIKEIYGIKEIADFNKLKDITDYYEIKKEINKKIEHLLPNRQTTNYDICDFCRFKDICLPDEIRQQRSQIWLDENLENYLNKISQLKENYKEYKRIDEQIKSTIKTTLKDEKVKEILTTNMKWIIKISRSENRTRIDYQKQEAKNEGTKQEVKDEERFDEYGSGDRERLDF